MNATIAKTFTFDAAHCLPQLPETHKCHRMHGHTYQVVITVSGVVGDDGFVADYNDIAEAWWPLHEVLDHRVLNEVKGLFVPQAKIWPSTEHVAGWILAHLLLAEGVLSNRWLGVTVHESSTTWCRVEPGDIGPTLRTHYTGRAP